MKRKTAETAEEKAHDTAKQLVALVSKITTGETRPLTKGEKRKLWQYANVLEVDLDNIVWRHVKRHYFDPEIEVKIGG